MKDKVEYIVFNLVRQIGQENNNDKLVDCNMQTKLYSENVDSMGVVFLLGDIEMAIKDEFDKDITLADDKAMSKTTSPFRSVESLICFIEEVLSVG